jgi:response regulator RpfG family c-di-GMP phosphodiesterase
MIERHAVLAGTLAAQLGLSQAVQDAVAASYEQWDGRGWPGRLAGEWIPVAPRLAQLAEFVEVAHRVGGVDAASALAARRAGTQFDPALAALLRADPEAILTGLDSTVRGTR